jgi:hypothetical protein
MQKIKMILTMYTGISVLLFRGFSESEFKVTVFFAYSQETSVSSVSNVSFDNDRSLSITQVF